MLVVIVFGLLLLKASLGELILMDTSARMPSSVTQIGEANLKSILHSNEVVFINFYANWCHFSVLLAPIFEHAAAHLKHEFPEPGKVLLGRVDCAQETDLADLYNIQKFPTLRLFYKGEAARREYRGQRSVDALVNYVKSQFHSDIVEFQGPEDLAIIDPHRRSVIAYFDSEGPAHKLYQHLADRYKNDCDFYQRIGKVEEGRPPVSLSFRPDVARTYSPNEEYEGDPADSNQLETWILQKCVPLVREINFKNVEELIEQRLPLLLLFHLPGDLKSVKDFRAIVEAQMPEMRGQYNFCTVDGVQFEHSVLHMGKSRKDLPIVAIDSLKFMYPFPNFNNIYKRGQLKKFLEDFLGHLKQETVPVTEATAKEGKNTEPPRSTFKDLGPSKYRYSLLHDEL
ncbi:uncharacterized protein Dana_GF14074 [Drosophila ananassae]|uniref:Thioredoxin domain-containing protein n=1 Tax=Drosophila ananassae TaxID=7217 RepID=B3MJU5_DROAN|nr:endoplasmic reticulum resident protein 44 [Drosophila ananassae]EDV32400.1 uncharacterized protein Dana_GF14074 [Drosophila ananassae]